MTTNIGLTHNEVKMLNSTFEYKWAMYYPPILREMLSSFIKISRTKYYLVW